MKKCKITKSKRVEDSRFYKAQFASIHLAVLASFLNDIMIFRAKTGK